MAWLEREPSGYYHVAFRFGCRRFKRSLGTAKVTEAEARRVRLEENIRLVESGRLSIPDGADVATFLLSDGKLDHRPVVPRTLTLKDLFEDYRRSLPEGAMEANSLYTATIHMNHLRRLLGPHYPARDLRLEHLQTYVTERSREKGMRGNGVSPTTIKKELTTFSSVWSWAELRGHVERPFPNKGLRFPKTHEKPPFQTWKAIETQIARGNLSEEEQRELWDCLFLSVDEIRRLLAYVKRASIHPFVYPMCCMAAHTGARRSEMIRSETVDFDFQTDTVRIRERKRSRTKRTSRIVPLSPPLRRVIWTWISNHAKGKYTFSRESCDTPLTVDEAHRDLQRTLADGRWDKIRGWHIFRHSFISNCAAKGIDQRMIDAWSGHQTDEMRRRYTHLFPDTQQGAIRLVFG